MASEKVLTVTKDNFDQEVLNSEKPVMVDFWAAWCGPCKAVSPVIDEIASDYDGKAKIGKLNVDEQREISEKYRVMSIPTILFFKDGQVVDKIVGARSKGEFIKLLDKYL